MGKKRQPPNILSYKITYGKKKTKEIPRDKSPRSYRNSINRKIKKEEVLKPTAVTTGIRYHLKKPSETNTFPDIGSTEKSHFIDEVTSGNPQSKPNSMKNTGNGIDNRAAKSKSFDIKNGNTIIDDLSSTVNESYIINQSSYGNGTAHNGTNSVPTNI